MLRTGLSLALVVAATPALSVGTFNEWTVDSDTSALFYVSTKNEHVAERHEISDISGGISADGALQIELDMASVDSGIDIRDQRQREHLFQVASFPIATITSDIDLSDYEDLDVGESTIDFFDGDLSIVGTETFIDFDIMVTRVSEDRVVVNSFGPAVINSADLELSSGVDKLRELANLPSISYSVPVTFTLSFDRN